MKYLLQILFIIPLFAFGQLSNEEIEREISSLSNKTQIEDYWNALHKKDQSVRGKVSDVQKAVDRENLKKMVTLIKYHGYPTGFCYGYKVDTFKNFTPNIIIAHNNVSPVIEYIFPIIRNGYEAGSANEFWYIHNLMGMVRNRYGRDFYEKKVENIPKYYDKLAPFVSTELGYDLNVIDSLFQEHDRALSEILMATKIFSKRKKRITNNVYKTTNGKMYWQKVYSDGSYNSPQEIYYDEENKCLRYIMLNEIIDSKILSDNMDKFMTAK